MRLNGIFCVLAVLWLGLLAAATCDTVKAAQWYMIAVAAGLAWMFVFVRTLYRRNWGVAGLWVVALAATVVVCLPGGPQIRMPAHMACRARMRRDAEHLRVYEELAKSQTSDADFWEFAEAGLCYQAGENVYHVCVELPQEDLRAACAVVAHARLGHRREGFSLVLPYERWKQVADSSPWRTPLGLPLVSRRETSVYVQWPESVPSRESGAALSAAGLLTCVENAAGLADFVSKVETASWEEAHRFGIYALKVLAVHVVSLAVAFGLFAWLVWRWLRRAEGVTPAPGEDVRWLWGKVGTVRVVSLVLLACVFLVIWWMR